MQAKNLFINVSYQNSATFVHFLEERNNVNYRFIKEFTAQYTDENGNTSVKTYSMFVRYLDKEVITTIDPMHDVFVKNSAAKETMFKMLGESEVDFIDHLCISPFRIVADNVAKSSGKIGACEYKSKFKRNIIIDYITDPEFVCTYSCIKK